QAKRPSGGLKPPIGKSRSFLQRFGRSPRESFLITNIDKALCCRMLAKLASERPLSYRYKLSICYWGSYLARMLVTAPRGDFAADDMRVGFGPSGSAP